jgi:hypothetical protein
MLCSRYAGLLLLALVGCFEQNDALTPPLVRNADLLERDVFATAITYVMGREPVKLDILDSNIVPLRQEADSAFFRMLADSVSPPDGELIADFRRRNARPGSVEGPLHGLAGYRWISAADVNPYHEHDGRILVGISHVGFGRDYRKALVYVTYRCGGLCGAGNYVWLERDGANVWHVTHERLDWVS